jgi:hypothetical protein
MRHRNHRGSIPLLVVGLLVAACGGSTTTSRAPQAPTDAGGGPVTTPAGNQPGGEPTTAPNPAGDAGKEGTASVTLGDTTWEFALSDDPREMCNPDMGGTFFVNLFGVDDTGQQVVFTVTAPGSGDAVVQVGAPDIAGELWIADSTIYDKTPGMEIPEGIGATVTVEGNSVSGTGTFYEDRAVSAARQSGASYDGGTRDGTFAASCPTG